MRRMLALLVLGLAFFVATEARAVELGPRLSIDFEGPDEDVAIGVEARIEIARLGGSVGLQLRPSLDFWLIEDWTVIGLSLDFLFAFDVGSAVIEPYAGLGIGLIYANPDGPRNSDSDAGLNLVGGMKFLPAGRVQPFVELRPTLGDDWDFTLLTFGVLFVL